MALKCGRLWPREARETGGEKKRQKLARSERV